MRRFKSCTELEYRMESYSLSTLAHRHYLSTRRSAHPPLETCTRLPSSLSPVEGVDTEVDLDVVAAAVKEAALWTRHVGGSGQQQPGRAGMRACVLRA